jgi:protease-4
LDGNMADRGKEQPFQLEELDGILPPNVLGVNDILRALASAKEDSKIDGIMLNVGTPSIGLASMQEIRNALSDFKKSGKFVYSYNNQLSQVAYFVSSVADSVFLNPEGNLAWHGLGYQVMFFKEALAKLGVEPQIIRHGTFKAAVEPFMYTKMSPENRKQCESFTSTMWNSVVDAVSKSRKISPEELNRIANELEVFDAPTALANKFVDKLLYRDEFMSRLTKLTDQNKEADLKLVNISDYVGSIERDAESHNADKIAVIYATGEISMGTGDDNKIGAASLGDAIREVREDSTIKAVVLRINSPGGDALASDIIWRELVVSMGDLAASGGYYIACNANYIYAQPATITGSIGVFGLFFNVNNLLNTKLGITTDVVKTNTHADALTITRPLDETELAVAHRSVEKVYNTFTTHVAAGRKMPIEKVLQIAEGRVWAGKDALQLGLVDSIGGLAQAIVKAQQLAKLTKYRTVDYPKQKDPIEELFGGAKTKIQHSILQDKLGESYQYVNRIEALQQLRGIQARMPFFADFTK